MNILISSAGQRVSLVQFFQKELKAIFPEGKVFTVDNNPSLAPACHISDGYFSVPKVLDENYIPELLSICLNNKISLVIPTIDTELLVLSENINLFKDKGVNIIVSSPSLIMQCRDKRKTNELFLNHHIEIPKQYDINSLSFPLFVKPCDGSLSKGIFIAKKKEDLTDEHFSNEKLMFMELISNGEYDEFTVDCYYDKNSELKCVVPRKRIFVRAGEVNKAVTKNNFIVTYFKENLSYLEGAKGCLTIQVFFHKQKDKILGIEINPRFGGGYPLSYLAGANYPKYIIQEYLLNQKIGFFAEWKNNLLMLRYDAEVLVENYE
ncbi:carbamoyl phosphate synthase large subunit [Haemophilus paracuniculus]|uniref:Carbamoyl phosphate synthase large subunit n=1 Tax=Haemophilus paracuniculus TaxID=734 RepID=A0A1T0ATI0_9PAST|nr:ATP-grasp domain-containing protein [Haemophilus paracuniculus]OOR99854.1 carbamoyl phosphate synthase large subunit [Haemophilus paracuniculus]